MGGVTKKLWRLAVRSEFSAGHALRRCRSKCEALHGHNFSVEMVVEGGSLQEDTELLVDFSVLKSLLNKALEGLDHSVLNESAPFDALNPSSENLARHIWQRLERAMEEPGVRLHSVTVGEKAGQSATYMEMEEQRSF
ncbi:MAG: 6-carboxytetrahydropterin synthase [Desulfovibrionaceae bacterium]|nr:6-carboxytetrahydropterin synthase [Desulfovibrionaceae bacterium]